MTGQLAVLRALGYPNATRFAGGMESDVYRVDGGLVAKVWKRTADVAVLRNFYAELADQHFTFRTPEIVHLDTVGGTVVSVEREIAGATLQQRLRQGSISTGAAQQVFLSVLTELHHTQAGPAARELAAMNEVMPFWRGHETWPQALVALVERRLSRFADQLDAAVPHFGVKAGHLIDALAGLPDRNQIIHGDICPENLLVDDTGEVAALLDWGFLSTAGDSAFDASTAAGFFNMYRATARVEDDDLLHRLESTYDRDLLLLYRAAYAVIGSNAYDDAGQDGHFEWCVQQLCRDDISDLLSRPIRRR